MWIMCCQRNAWRRRTLLLCTAAAIFMTIFRFGTSLFVVVVSDAAYMTVTTRPSTSATRTSAPAAVADDVPSQTPYVDNVAERASADRWIVVAVIDEAFLDMALNFYETSLKRLDIYNFLFVGFGDQVCKHMHVLSLPCYYYPESVNSKSASSFFSAEFTRKSHRRNNVIIDALEANYTVLYTDVDIVFLQNPLPELKTITRNADVATQWEHDVYNSGFVVARPTKGAISLYNEMNRLAEASPHRSKNQALMNAVIRKTHSLRMVKLSPTRYAGGLDYFETPGRSLANLSCVGCQDKSCTVIAHNTWIVSKAAKVYRFREHLLWMYDENGEYYGSKTNRYITYKDSLTDCKSRSSHIHGLDNVVQAKLATLQTALAIGMVLRRIVILPIYYCWPKCDKCRLNSLLQIANFDSVFAGSYRESSFLLHPQVPQSTKESMSEALQIYEISVESSNSSSTHKPQLVSDNSILQQFGDRSEVVLVFSSLGRNVVKFTDANVAASFNDKIKNGFRRGHYRQF